MEHSGRSDWHKRSIRRCETAKLTLKRNGYPNGYPFSFPFCASKSIKLQPVSEIDVGCIFYSASVGALAAEGEKALLIYV